VRQILRTQAVQTHLRWIRQLGLRNCMVAPEVWDYDRIKHLASEGRPICDVSFMLSVIHHIDGVSTEQYTRDGLSKADGTADLIAKLLSLAPNHFVELPYKPWLSAAYEAFGSQRGILEAATKRSQYDWKFVGPLFTVDWFGPRELWLLQVKGDMPTIDLQANPFLQLISDAEVDSVEDAVPAADAPVLPPRAQGAYPKLAAADVYGCLPGQLSGGRGADPNRDIMCLGPLGGVFANKDLGSLSAFPPSADSDGHGYPTRGNLQIDPAITALCAEKVEKVEDSIGDLLNKSPTPLLVAHLVLREAMDEAQRLLGEVRQANQQAQQAQQEMVASQTMGVQRPSARTPAATVAGARTYGHGAAVSQVAA